MSDVLVYVQHLLGIGHVRRMALINEALRAQGLHVTVASGGIAHSDLDFAADDVIALSPCKTSDTGFSTLVDADGNVLGKEWQDKRKSQLLSAFEATSPEILLVEMFPFGRRAFRFELIPLFDAAKEANIPIVCSVRDLLVRKKDIRKTEWMRDIARKYLDAVLVHGDPNLFGFDRSFEFTDDISDLISYTGYVAPKMDSNDLSGGQAQRQGLLVSAGGGAVGAKLISLAIEARSHSKRFCSSIWNIVTGPHFPQDHLEQLGKQLPEGVVLHRFLPDFRERMAGAEVSVSQAGYNTLMDVLATQTPAVMVPFAENGESEQTERAKILEKEGVISLLDLDGLSAQSLAKQIDNAKRPSGINIALDGAEKTASIIADKIKGKV